MKGVLALAGLLVPLSAAGGGGGKVPADPFAHAFRVPICDLPLPSVGAATFGDTFFLARGGSLLTLGRAPSGTWKRLREERIPFEGDPNPLAPPLLKGADGESWACDRGTLFRRLPEAGAWIAHVTPEALFQDFEVDGRGRILLVATSTRQGAPRALLEVADREGGSEALAGFPFPPPRLPSAQDGFFYYDFHSCSIGRWILLHDRASGHLLSFDTLSDSLRELQVPWASPAWDRPPSVTGQPLPAGRRACLQFVPTGDSGVQCFYYRPSPGGDVLASCEVDLVSGTAGEARDWPGLDLPVWAPRPGVALPLEAFLASLADPPPRVLPPPGSSRGPKPIPL